MLFSKFVSNRPDAANDKEIKNKIKLLVQIMNITFGKLWQGAVHIFQISSQKEVAKLFQHKFNVFAFVEQGKIALKSRGGLRRI